MRSARTSPSAVVVTSPEVAILTVLTRQKSHHSTTIFEAKEIGCYRQRGGVSGCDPANECTRSSDAYEPPGFSRGRSTLWSCQRTLFRPCRDLYC